MPSLSPSSLPRSARGQITWVTAAILAALLGGGYLAWVWVPVYIVDFQARQVVRDFMNRAVKDRNDDRLRADMIRRLEMLATDQVVDERGEPATVPAVALAPGDVVWERDTSGPAPTLHVAFEYVRVVELPYLDRTVEKSFTVDFTQDISIPDWGPSR